MTARTLPPQERLLELFSYDEETGALYRLTGRHAGKPADSHNGGYLQAHVSGFGTALVHRIIWKMLHGAEAVEVDHIDGDGANNRRANLRDSTHAQNVANSRIRSDNLVRRKGVSWAKREGKWTACIYVAGKQKRLGYFDLPEAAQDAYCDAARKYFGEFARAA